MSLAPEWLYSSDRLFALLLAGFAIELIVVGLLGFQQVLGLPRAVTVNVSAPTADLIGSKIETKLQNVSVDPGVSGASGGCCGKWRNLAVGGRYGSSELDRNCIGLQHRCLLRARCRATARKSVAARSTGACSRTQPLRGCALARGTKELFAVQLCDGPGDTVFWYVVVSLPGFAFAVS